MSDGAIGESLGKRLFTARVELLAELDKAVRGKPEADLAEPIRGLRVSVTERLREEVEGMTQDNFIVRPRRRYVEKYAQAGAWDDLGEDARLELIENVAGLPSSLVDDDLAATQFDLLILRTQLSVLRAEKSFDGYKKKVVQIAALLEELSNVPMVAQELVLIQEVQSDGFWTDVTLPMLDQVRRRLRSLVKLIEIKSRPIVY